MFSFADFNEVLEECEGSEIRRPSDYVLWPCVVSSGPSPDNGPDRPVMGRGEGGPGDYLICLLHNCRELKAMVAAVGYEGV